jgi:hypothetical protein
MRLPGERSAHVSRLGADITGPGHHLARFWDFPTVESAELAEIHAAIRPIDRFPTMCPRY